MRSHNVEHIQKVPDVMLCIICCIHVVTRLLQISAYLVLSLIQIRLKAEAMVHDKKIASLHIRPGHQRLPRSEASIKTVSTGRLPCHA